MCDTAAEKVYWYSGQHDTCRAADCVSDERLVSTYLLGAAVGIAPCRSYNDVDVMLQEPVRKSRESRRVSTAGSTSGNLTRTTTR